MSTERREEAAFHSEKEVLQAIDGLGRHDMKKLEAAAWTLIVRLRLDSAGRDHEDLLAEAFSRTLTGNRPWKQGVDFVRHLTETMRSVSWTWRERQDAEEQAGEAEPWEEAVSELHDPGPDPETRLIFADELRALWSDFEDDPQAMQVIACWEMGLDGPECCSRKGMTEKDLRAAVRRIRRHAQRRRAASGAIDAN